MRGRFLTALLLLLFTGGLQTFGKDLRIRMGTLAPDGSAWHLIFRQMAFDLKKETDGEVTLDIFAGGKTGDEGEMIRKMRFGQLQAAAISAIGLAEIDRAAYALTIPRMFESYEEWDYIRQRTNPELERRLEERGFIVLTWSDVGWVYFFSKVPIYHPDELRKLKLAASATDPVSVEIMKWARLNPVPITISDMVTGLQTGLIEAFSLPIVLAESSNLYREAKNMTDMKWAPLQGAFVIVKKSWDRLSTDQQLIIRELANSTGNRLREESRQREEASLQAMVSRGLKICTVDEDARKAWSELAVSAYPKIREDLVPSDIWDTVVSIREEYRRSHSVDLSAFKRSLE